MKKLYAVKTNLIKSVSVPVYADSEKEAIEIANKNSVDFVEHAWFDYACNAVVTVDNSAVAIDNIELVSKHFSGCEPDTFVYESDNLDTTLIEALAVSVNVVDDYMEFRRKMDDDDEEIQEYFDKVREFEESHSDLFKK